MRTIAFIITGPPTADIGSFVKVVDEAGDPVDVGWWAHDGVNWRYVMPVELVPRLAAWQALEQTPAYDDPKINAAYEAARDQALRQPVDLAPAIAARERRREQIRNARKKDSTASATPVASTADSPTTGTPPAHWETCPGCQLKFDPAQHELMSCGNCGEDRSTACCLKNPVSPCADCRALAAAGDEQGQEDAVEDLESPSGEEEGAPPAAALFDGKYRPSARQLRQARVEGTEVDDEEEEEE